MKRTLSLAVGILALGAAAYCGSQLSAQTGNQPAAGGAAPPASLLRNKVAVFNMSEVIKGYKRWQDFEQHRNSHLKQHQSRFDGFKAQITAKTDQLNKATPTDSAGREKLEKEIKSLQRQMAEMQDEVGSQFGKMEQEVVTTIYKEIEGMVNDIARAYQIEVVLHYTDAPAASKDEKYHPMNLARKLQSSGLTPIYMAPGIDISQWVLENLNKRYSASAAPAPAGGGTPAKQP